MSDEKAESIRLQLEEALNSLSDQTEQNFEAVWQKARRMSKHSKFGVRKP